MIGMAKKPTAYQSVMDYLDAVLDPETVVEIYLVPKPRKRRKNK